MIMDIFSKKQKYLFVQTSSDKLSHKIVERILVISVMTENSIFSLSVDYEKVIFRLIRFAIFPSIRCLAYISIFDRRP